MRKTSSSRPLTTLQTLAAASKAVNTRTAYASDLRHWQASGGRIPATPAQICGYLAAHFERLAVATLERRLCAIHWAHVEKRLRSPVHDASVKATLAGIRRIKGTAQRRVRALVKDDLLALLVGVGQQSATRAARDRALLLVGFAGAFRRSELVALTVADLNPCSGGIELNITRSKTDQEGKGRTVFLPAARGSQCPVAALNDWLAQTGITEGPIFRSVGKSGSVGAKGLSAQSVGLVVKDAVRRVNGDKAAASVAGHSLRSGFCTEAAAAGLMPWQIRAQTGHTSDAMLARYIRPAQNRAIPSLL